MAHNGYHQLMSLALDGMLAPADKAALDSHLDECAACAATWDAMVGLDGLFGRAPLVSPPSGFGMRVMAQVAARRVGRRRMETFFWFVMLLLLAVVMVSQWAPALAPAAVSLMPAPVTALAQQAKPLIESLETLKTALAALGEALGLWLAYVASLPVAWAAGLTALVLVATWVGLVGVFGPAQTPAFSGERVRAW